jgi:GT2 family glycosyltransferase/glycosyltransferase involved in cell wall biosynthesis
LTLTRPSPRQPSGTGVLVFGMHRSGTSAITRLLQEAGADVGERVVPGSAGNEEGHWEDAFAVELNERLLAEFGRRWDDVRPLPGGWLQSEAAVQARLQIVNYLVSSRSRTALWAIKDPRMCVLADLWMAAVREANCRHAVVLLARHPLEVADSLAARDGMAPGKAALLWMRHMVDAERATRGAPRLALTYDDLLADPASLLLRMRSLGVSALGAITPQSVNVARRHHRVNRETLVGPLGEAWEVFRSAGKDGSVQESALDRCARVLADADLLYAPVLTELEREQAALWQRTARAEAALVEYSAQALGEQQALAPAVQGLGEALTSGIERVLGAISEDIRRMQEEHARAITSAATLSAEGDRARRELLQAVERQAQLEGALLAAKAQAQELQGAFSAARERAELREEELARIRMEMSQLRADVQLREQDISQLRADIQTREHALSREQSANRDALQRIETLRESENSMRLRLQEYEARAEALQRRLDGLDAEFTRVLGSRSWRITRPLRLAARLFSGRLADSDRERFRSWLRRLPGLRRSPRNFLQPGATSSPLLVVANEAKSNARSPWVSRQQPGKPDVFVWAVIDWHFRTQRPQHLARGLADGGHRVFYLSNNLVDSPDPGFSIESLDDSGRLFQVFLNAKNAPAIYYACPSAATAEQLRRSMGELMRWAESRTGLCIVQHPFWTSIAASIPGAELVYDCMDHHAGFGDNAPDILQAEARLIEQADLVVVSSAWLDNELADKNPHRALIRNAGDFEHFRDAPPECFRDPHGRPVIGYYGAIAEWFDVELVRGVARAFPDHLVLLVGSDTAGVAKQLADEPNIMFTGEVPYARLPYYLHAFAVALLPFRVMTLTLATNPVKVYEYLSAGKPVVSVDLPEIQQFGHLVRRASDHPSFIREVELALGERDVALREARLRFASEQTWSHRALELDEAIARLPTPLVSVIVLTYNNLDFTKACLRSIEAESCWPNLEVIVVDNASSDGTRAFLEEWERGGPGRRIILNERNLGFSAGNNVGLAAANGDYLVLLNNDTYVTPHWVGTMVKHLARDPGIGILGPVTNNIGNEARVEIHYADMDEMKHAAAAYTSRRMGRLFDVDTVAFFCVAMPRSTYERIGPMDEAFGVGFFEDDDYCRRVQAAGLRVVCADDVFVHHHLSASFDALKAEKKQELFERNKAIYEAKWGQWKPHAYRTETDGAAGAPSAKPE